MTRKETLARAGMLERPDTAYLVPGNGMSGGLTEYEVTWDDLARDAAWARERLRDLGLERGRHALLSFYCYEGPWFQPVIEALRDLGAVYGIAEALGWDHARIRVFHRELNPHAVIGLSLETVDGLSGQVDLGDFFGGTPVVLARPEAAERLRGAGVSAGVISSLGPALAIECSERAGAHVNGAEWKVAARDGGLVVAAAGERAIGPAETVLEVAGSVVTERCACGSDDPRVLFG